MEAVLVEVEVETKDRFENINTSIALTDNGNLKEVTFLLVC